VGFSVFRVLVAKNKKIGSSHTLILDRKDSPVKIKVYGMSSPGKRKNISEDYFGIFPPEGLQNEDERNIYVIADGMGGSKGGEIASKKVVENIINFFAKNIQIDDKFILSNQDEISKRLEYAILDAHQKLKEEVLIHPEIKGMGTTVVTAHIHNKKLYLSYVGDSRCYRIRNKQVECLTKDHSLVQELYDAGQITLPQLKTHPRRNIITQALGVSDEIKCDFRIEKLNEDDIFLLCTDGLNSVVEDEEIKEIILQQKGNLKTACRKLIERADDKGRKDDITTLIIHISHI